MDISGTAAVSHLAVLYCTTATLPTSSMKLVSKGQSNLANDDIAHLSYSPCGSTRRVDCPGGCT